MAQTKSRSPRSKPASKPKVTRLVQTLVSEDAGRELDAQIAITGDSESGYVRRLIYADLEKNRHRH